MTARDILSQSGTWSNNIEPTLASLRSLMLAEVEKLPDLCDRQVSRADLTKIIKDMLK